MDAAVKMNVLDGVKETYQRTREEDKNRPKYDGVEISVHANSAPDHEDIQGHQFTNEQFERINNGLPFKDVNGKRYAAIRRPCAMNIWNCSHIAFGIFVGEESTYSQKELNAIKAKNGKGFTYEGKHYTGYEAKQMQNKLYGEMKKLRDASVIAEESGDTDLLNEVQAKARGFSKHYRLFSKAANVFYEEPLTNYEESDIIKTAPNEFKIYEDIKNGADIQKLADKGFINNQYKPNEGYEDKLLKRIAQEQGFDALPNVVDRNGIESRIADGEPELFRGVSDEKYAEQLQNGEYFAGTGIHGSGTYLAGYANISKRGVAIDTAFDYIKDTGVVMRMTLDKSAKIANLNDIRDELYSGALKGTNYQALKDPLKILEANFGRYAAMKGYDAIFVEEKNFYVVLNRAKLNIEKNFYKRGDL